jgi:hypothetical protein
MGQRQGRQFGGAARGGRFPAGDNFPALGARHFGDEMNGRHTFLLIIFIDDYKA